MNIKQMAFLFQKTSSARSTSRNTRISCLPSRRSLKKAMERTLVKRRIPRTAASPVRSTRRSVMRRLTLKRKCMGSPRTTAVLDCMAASKTVSFLKGRNRICYTPLSQPRAPASTSLKLRYLGYWQLGLEPWSLGT